MGKVIAIDGPSGLEQGTIAKLLAGKLGFSYLDTGALYRAVALCLKGKRINPEDSDEDSQALLRGYRHCFQRREKYFLKTLNSQL